MIDWDAYTKATQDTAVYPGSGEYNGTGNTADDFLHETGSVLYTVLGLVGEAGEVVDVVKKAWRKHPNGFGTMLEEDYDGMCSKVMDELGDVMWYVAALCSELDLNFEAVLSQNVTKLAQRKAEGTLKERLATTPDQDMHAALQQLKMAAERASKVTVTPEVRDVDFGTAVCTVCGRPRTYGPGAHWECAIKEELVDPAERDD